MRDLTIYGREKYQWAESITKYILIRDVGLDATGKSDHKSLQLASKLKMSHHQGAGGESDFKPTEAFQKLNKETRFKSKIPEVGYTCHLQKDEAHLRF